MKKRKHILESLTYSFIITLIFASTSCSEKENSGSQSKDHSGLKPVDLNATVVCDGQKVTFHDSVAVYDPEYNRLSVVFYTHNLTDKDYEVIEQGFSYGVSQYAPVPEDSPFDHNVEVVVTVPDFDLSSKKYAGEFIHLSFQDFVREAFAENITTDINSLDHMSLDICSSNGLQYVLLALKGRDTDVTGRTTYDYDFDTTSYLIIEK